MPRVDTVVFDIGNVLIQWNPRNLYRRLIPDETEMERFLSEVCTDAWNLEQDRGRTWAEAVAERIALFPDHADLIRAYDTGWHEMVPGEVPGSRAVLEELHEAGVPLYAITNFSAEKFAEAVDRFPFLKLFRETIVSAHERTCSVVSYPQRLNSGKQMISAPCATASSHQRATLRTFSAVPPGTLAMLTAATTTSLIVSLL